MPDPHRLCQILMGHARSSRAMPDPHGQCLVLASPSNPHKHACCSHPPPCSQLHKVQADTGENHAVSAMKFGILKEFLDIGYSVLLSDVDIVVLQVWGWRCGSGAQLI
eukprot:364632-Chlamydomonas_euryale.AAC.1